MVLLTYQLSLTEKNMVSSDGWVIIYQKITRNKYQCEKLEVDSVGRIMKECLLDGLAVQLQVEQ